MLTLDFSPFPVINTERLILREIGYPDAADLYILRSDPRVMRDRTLATSIDDVSKFIGRIKEALSSQQGITWAITLRDSGQVIGTIGFWRIITEHKRAEIGYDLLPEQTGKGIMQEAISAVLDYGFQNIKLHSVEANVNPDNERSIALLERNKFVREGYFKENYFSNGQFTDSAIYSLLSPF